jgi:ribosomal protein S18 acetylase RimI-like enzyme
MSVSTTGTETELLDNLVWHSLTGHHAHLAEGAGLARRYHPDVAVFVAIVRAEPAAWNELRDLVGPGATVAVTGNASAAPPADWARVGGGTGYQMVLRRPELLASKDPDLRVEQLTTSDVPQMLELVALAQPGPFRPRTIEMGSYFGVFDDERQLIGLAGERLRVSGFTEISAVSTHPSARQQGIASQLTSHLARHIQRRGDTPILHVAATNVNAKRIYDRLGFEVRGELKFAALEAPR